MALKTISPNTTIYEKGAPANEIALIVKGSVSLQIGTHTLDINAGSIIGISERIGKKRRYSYSTNTETTIYTYEFSSDDILLKLLSENEKLAPTITLSLIKNAAGILEIDRELHRKAKYEYEKLILDLQSYPDLCAKTAKEVKNFSSLKSIDSPDFKSEITEWKASFIHAISTEENLMSRVYSIGSNVCAGFAMQCQDCLKEISEDIKKILKNLDRFHKKTLEFRTEISTLNNEANAIDSGEEVISMPSMEDSLSQILLYSGYNDEKASDLTDAINSYVKIKNRTDTNDSLRTLRRRIASHYYEVYKAIFLKSIKDKDIPPIIKMFLYFGYIDERIVEKDDLNKLYGFSCAYRYNGGKILSIYDWLKLVFAKRVAPSLNEFQQDYPTYLKELKTNGDIDEEEMNRQLHSSTARLEFEIKNLFTLGNRMTFGRVSLFVPIFDSQCKMLPLDKSHLSEDILSTQLNRIREIDYSIFYRTKIFVMPNNESIQFFLHEEQTPFIILFPIVGQNMILWQTIEGRVRNSSARMMLPMFFEDNVEKAFTRVCGDYRWEVCKTDQGVRWTDITDPSLTAEYHDFLQFYKKNGSLTKEQKEKVKTAIKKHSNNYKKVFIEDYASYIQFESAGNMRLLKYSRDIMFKYCPFSAKIRESLQTSPQYEKLLEIRANKLEQKLRPLQNIIQKTKSHGDDVPVELEEEIRFLES